jgi:hypothetical protein
MFNPIDALPAIPAAFPMPARDTLIANIDPLTGAVIWAFAYDFTGYGLGPVGGSRGNSIGVDMVGMTSIVGTVYEAGDPQIYAFQFDPAGGFIGGYYFVNPGPDSGNGVAVTPMGETYGTGCLFNGVGCDALVFYDIGILIAAPIWGVPVFAPSGDLVGHGIDVDGAGYAFVAGSIDPLPDRDAVLFKLDPTGTYIADFDIIADLGSGGAEEARAVDVIFPTTMANVTGMTNSFDLPVTPGVLQPFYAGPFPPPPEPPIIGDSIISAHDLPLP